MTLLHGMLHAVRGVTTLRAHMGLRAGGTSRCVKARAREKHDDGAESSGARSGGERTHVAHRAIPDRGRGDGGVTTASTWDCVGARLHDVCHAQLLKSCCVLSVAYKPLFLILISVPYARVETI